MADNSLKTSELVQSANIAATDRIVILYNANNANTIPSTRSIPFATFCANLVILNSTPGNSSSNGLPGNISYDNNYFYICTSNNKWGRIALSTF